MKAQLTNYAQSPRKVRLVADLIRGKKVADAQAELSFLVKRAALPFQKLLSSAIANAKANFDVNPENLFVSDVRVDKGIVMKRMMPRAMGRGFRINKRTSHVILVLSEKNKEVQKSKIKVKNEAPKAEVKEEVKAPAKKKVVAKAKKKKE